MPRLRSDSAGKAQIFLAQNPERECPLRKICGKGEHGGGWINDDGTVDASMDGVVMFFYMHEGDMDKMYWGRTKREVYEKCKDLIDMRMEQDPDMTYEDFILSMVFFTFDIRDNKKTYLILKALEVAPMQEREELKKWFSTTDCNDDEKVASVLKIYAGLNIKEKVEEAIETEFESARRHLDAIRVEEAQKRPLRELTEALLGRKK
jgi:hypothetical protein